MRIGIFYPTSSIRIPINPDNIWTDSRGLTGSEGSCVMYALSLSKLGHSVTLFTKLTKPGKIDNVTCCPYEEWGSLYHKQHWDSLCSWMTPEPLKIASKNSFRVFNQQVSDFSCCPPSWESYVDLLTPLSNSHANYLLKYTNFNRNLWRISYNGVDCNKFKPSKKIPGKVIWASSHDRGLHWLLEIWPIVKMNVPKATLHIFYDFNGLETFSKMEYQDPSTESGRRFNELAFRSRYTSEAIRRLGEKHGVFTYKSVSRERIQQEMSTAEVLAFPLNAIHYTETFGVTVLESCASGTVPVICTDDCFDELWGSVSESVPPPYPIHKNEYTNKLINILIDNEKRISMSEKCVEYAKKFSWDKLGKVFEQTLIDMNDPGGMSHVEWK